MGLPAASSQSFNLRELGSGGFFSISVPHQDAQCTPRSHFSHVLQLYQLSCSFWEKSKGSEDGDRKASDSCAAQTAEIPHLFPCRRTHAGYACYPTASERLLKSQGVHQVLQTNRIAAHHILPQFSLLQGNRGWAARGCEWQRPTCLCWSAGLQVAQ